MYALFPQRILRTLVTSDLYSEIPTWHIGTNAKFKEAASVPKSFERKILPVSDCSP
jgi:hypothetical protein